MSDYDEIFAADKKQEPIHGVVVGLVSNTKDEAGLGRVKLKLPWLADDVETDWARVAAPMAGPSRGLYFPLEPDDEVLVAFERGDIRRPYVIGALWNSSDKPPDPNAEGKNDVRVIKSRSGHIVRLDDTDGAEKIEIIDKSGDNTITIDTTKNSVSIAAKTDVTVQAMNGNLELSGANIKIMAKQQLSLKGATAEFTADGETKIKGAVVNIN